MKRVLSFLLCLCLIMGMIPAALASEAPRYLALGDSITAGTRLNDGEPAFPQIIAQQNGYDLNNQGVNGMTATKLYESLMTGGLDEAVMSADLITITCGGNDLLAVLYAEIARVYNARYWPDISASDVVPILSNSSNIRFLPLLLTALEVLGGSEATGAQPFAQRAVFLQEIDRFIAKLNLVTGYIREKNPDVTIIMPTQYNPYKNFSGTYAVVASAMDEAARKLNAAIVANAETGGYLTVDVFTVFQENSQTLCNAVMDPLDLDFHPNAAGHAVMAQVFQELIDTLAPEEPVPEETIPEETAPEESIPDETAPEETVPEETVPEETVPEETVPEEEETVINPFVDVEQDDYFYDSVLWAVAKEITTGTSADRFSPDADCTRAQVVTFLWRAAGKPAPQSTENPFTDVDPTDYYYEAVLWAAENGITTGVKADQFGPKDPCTRAQVVTFLWRAAGKPEVLSDSAAFADVEPDDYFAPAVLWAVENQITLGTGNGLYEPKTTCSRAQTVTFLYRSAKTE